MYSPGLVFAAFVKQEIFDFILVSLIDLNTFLNDLAEFFVETDVVVDRLFHHVFERRKNFAADVLFNFFDDDVLL